MTATATHSGQSPQAEAIGADRVEGPLKGHHHQTFAVRLDPSSPLAGDFPWLKLREPREGALWYDMRWFPSEEALLRLLREQDLPASCRVPRVGGQTIGGQPVTFLAFIEGVTLDRVPGNRAGRVAERYLRQIEDVFGALAGVDADALIGHGVPPVPACPDCDLAAHRGEGASSDFLRRLTHFTATHAYQQERQQMLGLLEDLEVAPDALAAFARCNPRLHDRPRRLVHGDLHRRNFVVDRAGDLWTIDWELALVGDPVYDLATHLHLMGYQPDQEADVVARWTRVVGADCSAGVDQDLPHYRAFKKVQSLCTDVVRAVERLRDAGAGREAAAGTGAGPAAGAGTSAGAGPAAGTGPRPEALRRAVGGAAASVWRALEAAREPLGLEKALPRPAVESVLKAWWERSCASRRRGGPGA